jgi:uncharacterized Tic20 family protein
MTESQPTSPARPLSPSDENLWSTLAHIGNVLGFLPSLLILLILGPRSTRVRQESREALNFVITAIIVWVALWVVGIVVGSIADAAPSVIGLLFVLLGLLIGLAEFAVWVLLVVFSIVAAVRVNSGASYRYPFSLRLIK